jgi:type VI protein secretion system component VasF
MCRMSINLGASNSQNPQGLSRPVQWQLYLLVQILALLTVIRWKYVNLLWSFRLLTWKLLLSTHIWFRIFIWRWKQTFFRNLARLLPQNMMIAAQYVIWTKYLVHYHRSLYFVTICVLSDAKLKHNHVWSNKQSLLSERATRRVAKQLTWFKAPGSPRVSPHISLDQGRQNTGLWRQVSWPDSDHVAWPFPRLLFVAMSL